MKNFSFHNPTRIQFGEGEIHSLSKHINKSERILFLYGTGSIKKNGVYNEVTEALAGFNISEFSGITANPRYEDCLKAIKQAQTEKITFILAVGGGSVIDAAKFIAAGFYCNGDPWDLVIGKEKITKALPIGTLLTLPATGSEMNGNSVITKDATKEKRGFYSPLFYPKFSILDPRTMKSLPKKQIVNGVVDAFTHVLEQYLTDYQDNFISDRLAEGVLLSLIDVGTKIVENQNDLKLCSNLMWSASMALNGIVGLGTPGDWATHQIGHELTAKYGVDHAESLAIVLPSLLNLQKNVKGEKLLQFGERVFKVKGADETIAALLKFYHSVGMRTKLSDYKIDANEAAEFVSNRFKSYGYNIGEKRDIDPKKIKEILLNTK